MDVSNWEPCRKCSGKCTVNEYRTFIGHKGKEQHLIDVTCPQCGGRGWVPPKR